MTRPALVLYVLGFFALGLGLGMGWGHDWTPYPALVGMLLEILGAVALLAAIVVGWWRGTTSEVEVVALSESTPKEDGEAGNDGA